MEVQDLREGLDELYCNRSSYWVPDLEYLRTEDTEWKLGPIFTERETYDYDGIREDLITEAAGVCVAVQVREPQPGLEGIAKIRIIPNDGPSSTKPYNVSMRSGLRLVQSEKDPVPGGLLSIMVMERLPGRNLVNFADLPISERDQVRLAFAKAIREFNSFRFVHRYPDRRNLIWDPENKKCYIIDLEDAHLIDSDAEPKKFILEKDFHSWGIAGPEINTNMYGLDPMVPHDLDFIEDPDDETLERMAETEGKELVYVKDDWDMLVLVRKMGNAIQGAAGTGGGG